MRVLLRVGFIARAVFIAPLGNASGFAGELFFVVAVARLGRGRRAGLGTFRARLTILLPCSGSAAFSRPGGGLLLLVYIVVQIYMREKVQCTYAGFFIARCSLTSCRPAC